MEGEGRCDMGVDEVTDDWEVELDFGDFTYCFKGGLVVHGEEMVGMDGDVMVSHGAAATIRVDEPGEIHGNGVGNSGILEPGMYLVNEDGIEHCDG